MKNKQILISNGVDFDNIINMFGSVEIYNAALVKFVTESPKYIIKINEAQLNDDLGIYNESVNCLIDLITNLGLVKLYDVLLLHEIESKSENDIYIENEYQELLKHLKVSISFVTEYLNSDVDILKDKSIIIADDSSIIRNYIKRVFKESFNIIEASDGARLVEVIENLDLLKVDLLFLDLSMPEMDGFEVLEYMKVNKIFKDLAVCIVTGDDTKDSISRVFKYPIIDVLNKPFNENDLRKLLEKAKHISEQ